MAYSLLIPLELGFIVDSFLNVSVNSFSTLYGLETSHYPHYFLAEKVKTLVHLDTHLITRFGLQNFSELNVIKKINTIKKITQFYKTIIDDLNSLQKQYGFPVIKKKLPINLDTNFVDLVEYIKAYNKIKLWTKLPGGIEHLHSPGMKKLSMIEKANRLRDWIVNNFNVNNIRYLNLSDLGLTQMPEEIINLFNNLERLNLSHNNISEIDLSALTQLKTLILSHNNISEIDLSALTQLETLILSHNNISKIDLSTLTQLKILVLFHNNISEIDLSALTQLETLILSHNNISKIDLNGLTRLIWLNLSHNNISKIDLSALHSKIK